MEKEIWADIKGYEGLYQVSTYGRVRSLKSSCLLKGRKDKDGYYDVTLFKDKKRHWYRVHRLVAEAFIPNWFDDPQVNHRDENKENNHIDNLEWCSLKYNLDYGTRWKRILDKTTNGKKSKTLIQYTLSGEFVREWPSTHEVERSLGYKNQNISSCCIGKKSTAYGYIWRYKEKKEVV